MDETILDFDRVYAEHYPNAYRVALGILLDAGLAEDVTQDAFTKAYRKRDSFRPTGSLGAWIHTIVAREAISRLRWRRLQQRLLDTLGQFHQAEIDFDARDTVLRLLALLSPKTRAAVVLHHVHGYRYREIAVILGIPEGTVATRISNGLKQMRAVMVAATEEREPAIR